VDENNGIFKIINHSDLKSFLTDPMTGALYLRYFCIPLFKRYDIEYCKKVVANPDLISNSTFKEDTQWLVR